MIDCDPIVELRKACAAAGTQKAWAQAHGLSPQYVSDVLRGKPPGEAILSALGIERVYRRSAFAENKDVRRCKAPFVGAAGECLACGADQGVACREQDQSDAIGLSSGGVPNL